MKKALITGITGQDGSYLAELLLGKGYEVHGLIRRSSSINTRRIDHIYEDPHIPGARVFLHFGDMTDGGGLSNLISKIMPDEIYNLAAQSHVRVSFDSPEYTENVVALGATRLLEAIRQINPEIKYYQASSSEMFGDALPWQDENTPMKPNSPYAVAKLHAYLSTINYRTAYSMFACNGILFNHESPRRGETFVTRKISMAVARIQAGLQDKLFLGNLDARRDWGYAGDYVEAMYEMMQLPQSEDIVIGTGKTYSIREFLAEAFGFVGLDWQKYVEIDPRYYRPNEVNVLAANCAKAKDLLEWTPRVGFGELVRLMVDSDIKELKK